MNDNFRPAAIPLVTVDPYFSVWSTSNCLYEDTTKHWTGKPNGMTGIIWIDDKAYNFMGKVSENTEVLKQESVSVKPLTTIYTFKGNGIKLQVKFLTPLLLTDLELTSRPASYIDFIVSSIDENPHIVKIYFDVTGEWCVNSPDQKIKWGRKELSENIETMFMCNEKQEVLSKSGDDLRIDWGYFYLVVPKTAEIDYTTVIGTSDIRNKFILDGLIPVKDDDVMPRNLEDDMTVMAVTLGFGSVYETQKSNYIVLAYDDIKSIEYFSKPLSALWRSHCDSFDNLLVKTVKEYSDISHKCEVFDEKLIKDSTLAGGKKYAELISLAYRQAVAAHKLVTDENGDVLFFSKECFSNGCIATVDVTYPSIPLFLLFNTELVKGMLRPIFKYFNSDAWTFDFAPHDVGCYPIANGQVYGENALENQMPVEECGNMLITMAAVSIIDKNADFAQENFTPLTCWVDYLVIKGFDPGNQLCTDDFAGHLSHNSNLSIKAILGIASYAILCKMLGYEEKHSYYLNIAKDFAIKWETINKENDHYKLTFDGNDSWSLKYNLIWDSLLGLNIFSKDIKQAEVEYYIKKQNKYGVPLDSRETYTKTDWIVWSASLSDNKEDFEALIAPIWDFINESESRVPFTDWYDTISCMQIGFQNRSVLGGIFIKLLKVN
ncbi:MAG TPA: DUF4965 domain-containing protein [Clostridiaceae bacterium]